MLDIFIAAGLPQALCTSESLFETIVKSCERSLIISSYDYAWLQLKSLGLQNRVNKFIDRVSQFSIDEMDIFLCVIYKNGDLLLQNCAEYVSSQYGEQ